VPRYMKRSNKKKRAEPGSSAPLSCPCCCDFDAGLRDLGHPVQRCAGLPHRGDRGFSVLGKCRLGRHPQRWTGSRRRGLSQPQCWARVINRAVSSSIGLTLIIVGVPTSLLGYSHPIIACLFRRSVGAGRHWVSQPRVVLGVLLNDELGCATSRTHAAECRC